MEMDSRERTFLALEHKAGDRLPVDFWASKAMVQKLEKGLRVSYAQFLDQHDVDLRYLPGPAYTGPTLRVPQLWSDHDSSRCRNGLGII